MPTQVDFDPFADESKAPTGGGVPVDFDPFYEPAPEPSRAALTGPELWARVNATTGTSQRPTASAAPPDSFGRQLGLTARLGVNVLTGIPQIFGNAANAFVNTMGPEPANRLLDMFGSEKRVPLLGSVTEATDNLLTNAGIPQAETPIEKLVQIGGSAVGGAGLAGAAARAPGMSPSLARLLTEMSMNPRLQAAGAAAGGAAQMGAEDLGVKNPYALMGIGMIGSILPGSAATIGTRAASVAPQLARPFTQAGREVLVGKALNRIATNPAQAAANMAESAEVVPGSRPMVSQVSRDAGLIQAERALPDETGIIPARKSEQNAARMRDLDRIAGDDQTLTHALDKQQRAYDEYAVPAFARARPVDIGRDATTNPILARIEEIRSSPAGARGTVQDAMSEAESLLTNGNIDVTDVQTLYEIRKDLRLLRDGKLAGPGKSGAERSNLGNAREQLNGVIRELDNTIETGAPGYRDYMQMYAKRSVPVDQIKALQSLRDKAVLSAPDPITNQPTPILSQDKFTKLLRNNIAPNRTYGGIGPGVGTLKGNNPATGERVLANLSPNHIRTLDRIATDLDRSTATTAGTMRSGGSDTFKNMSIAGVIGRVLGDQAGELASQNSAVKTISRPLNFLYRVPDRDIQLLMLEAWTDPRLASRLMRQATQHEVDGIAAELKTRLSKQITAQAIYGQAE